MGLSDGEWGWLANFANAATVLTGVAVVFAVVPFFQARKRERQDADQWYVDRYWQLQDQKRPRRGRGRQVRVDSPFAVRWAELRLCEDELDARANGWITNDSWAVWQGAILAHRDDPLMLDLVARTPSDELTLLREFWLTGADPIIINRWRQFWRGIR
ncbi:hypothetical protein [Microbacterium phyllosphaerae]|uniref:hypothetical protein n=1 Tax=Microbacterium phyllosphaerae TaxID=124798 RepID=UPI0011AE5199|nr:hypothetical protein [Microbacterium phyllosphaerae]